MKKISTLLLVSALAAPGVYADQEPKDYVSDSVVTSKVQMQIVRDHFIKPGQVKVRTENGLVHLEGELDSRLAYDQAISIADSVEGVKDIDASHLKVRHHDHLMNDLWLASKIKSKCLKRKLDNQDTFTYNDLNVDVNQGCAFIKAEVKNKQDKDKLYDIVHEIEGIKSINMDVAVES